MEKSSLCYFPIRMVLCLSKYGHSRNKFLHLLYTIYFLQKKIHRYIQYINVTEPTHNRSRFIVREYTASVLRHTLSAVIARTHYFLAELSPLLDFLFRIEELAISARSFAITPTTSVDLHLTLFNCVLSAQNTKTNVKRVMIALSKSKNESTCMSNVYLV